MNKRKFGMRYLNITQGRFSSYSHKYLNAYDLAGEDTGIDKYVTFNELEVVGVLPYSSTGFANTVLFYDEENDVTLAFSHCNFIPAVCSVGNKIQSGITIYYEGTTGNVTGNHIHLEIGKGKQRTKTKINNIWQLKDLINIEDYFYIDDTYTTILNDDVYEFEIEGGELMEFKEGYQNLTYLDRTVNVYKQSFENIGLLSAIETGVENYKAVQTIDKIDNDFFHYAKVNCGFFNLTSGEHYGVEQGFDNDFAPKQDGLLCLYIDKENKPHYLKSSEYWLTRNDVILAFTPKAVLRHEGVDLSVVSTSYNPNLYQRTTNTLLLYLPDGKYAFMTTKGDLNLYECRDFAKQYGAVGIYALDGGNSTQMIVKGSKVQYTARKIANALTFYLEQLPSTDKPAKEDPEEELNKLKEENATLKQKLTEIDEIIKR